MGQLQPKNRITTKKHKKTNKYKTQNNSCGILICHICSGGPRSCRCRCSCSERHICDSKCGVLLRHICSGWCCISSDMRCTCGILKNSTATSHNVGNTTPPRANVTKKNSTTTSHNVGNATPPRINATKKNSTLTATTSTSNNVDHKFTKRRQRSLNE